MSCQSECENVHLEPIESNYLSSQVEDGYEQAHPPQAEDLYTYSLLKYKKQNTLKSNKSVYKGTGQEPTLRKSQSGKFDAKSDSADSIKVNKKSISRKQSDQSQNRFTFL